MHLLICASDTEDYGGLYFFLIYLHRAASFKFIDMVLGKIYTVIS